MKKSIIKVFSVILVVVLTLTSAPLSGLVGLELPEWLDFSIISSAAETSGTCGENVTWTFDESAGTLTISGTGAMFDYDSNNRPWYRYSIKKVIIGNGVTTIGDYAFWDCNSLTNVTIPDSVTTIGDYAFWDCNSLTNVTIPDSVTTIGGCAFEYCDSLTSVTIPDSITSIGSGAFAYCTSLTSVTIPNDLTAIGSCMFQGCRSLTSITIPDNVTLIGTKAFQGCTSLTSVTIPDSVTSIGQSAFDDTAYYNDASNWENNVLYIGNHLIEAKISISGNYEIKEGTITIARYAFDSCDNLTSVIIPDSITSISYGAFWYCRSLTSVTIPDSVKLIDYCAFQGCTSLTSVTIPDSVKLIDYCAFQGCTSLTSITIPNSVTSIGSEVFAGCTSLTSVIIPDSITSISYGAFWSCRSLTSVTIPDSITSIGYGAFYYCDSLTDVYYNGTEEQWYNISINNQNHYNIQLHKATIHFNSSGENIPDDVTSDKTGTCGNNLSWSLDNNGVLTISGKGDMYNWPDALSAPWADYRNSISSIVIEEGVTSVGTYAFNYCMNCTSVSIPDTVTSIGDYAFDTCSSLTSITIPVSVTSIGDYAFYNCIKVTNVYYLGTDKQWNEIEIGVGNVFTTAKLHMDTCKLSELSSVDYLAFSQLSYRDDLDVSATTTIRESLKDIWNDEWANNITYGELYAEIASWTACKFVSNSKNGFAAYIFTNDYNEFVVAFRGSVSVPENWFNLLNPDWSQNDIPMFFGGDGSQIEEAFAFVKDTVNKYGVNSIRITGHSLGGALCDIVSARYNCEAHSFNAAPFLANAYYHHPDEMGQLFSGVDDWKFVDHVTESDFVGGLSLWVKNYMIHEHNGSEEAAHSLASMVDRNSSNTLVLTPPTPEEPSPKNSNILNYGTNGGLFLGTTYLDYLLFPDAILNTVAYGGDFSDEISTGLGNDTLIGGKGNDLLDGGYGNDSYYYFKGDGVDFIWDIDGEINVYLYGFDKNDKFEGVEQPGNRWLYCNDELILMISEENPINIYIYNNYTCEEDKELIKTIKYNSKSYNPLRWLIACPVNVEIINDENNEVVYTLYDGTEGTYYTEYGYFYVYQDENGDYVKIADLYEGYSIRIIGTDTGTMDVSVSNFASGEDNSTFSAVNVPVTSSLVATVEEIDNEKYLVIDSDGDGNIDNRVQLVEEKEYNYTFSIQTPSTTSIRHKDGIKLHAKVEGTAPADSYVRWESSNGNFDKSADGSNLKIIAKNKGWTTFTAILCDADGNELARDSVEMYSKSGFFDKIGGFFRSLFGGTKIYEN